MFVDAIVCCSYSLSSFSFRR